MSLLSPTIDHIQYIRRFARFGTTCTILKNVKNTHGRVIVLVTLLKVTLLHGCFSRFVNSRMVTNRRKHYYYLAYNCIVLSKYLSTGQIKMFSPVSHITPIFHCCACPLKTTGNLWFCDISRGVDN